MNSEEQELFIQSFNNGFGSCRVNCECGKIYYNESFNNWEKGEFEELENKGVPLNHDIGYIEFEGSVYADVCKCWHPRAERIIGFIKSHKFQIAEFVNKIKQSHLKIVKNYPDIDLGFKISK